MELSVTTVSYKVSANECTKMSANILEKSRINVDKDCLRKQFASYRVPRDVRQFSHKSWTETQIRAPLW